MKKQVYIVPSDFKEDDTLARLERYIAEPPENSRIFTITPMMAQKLLSKWNTGNRSKKPQKIETYAKDMAAQHWKITGDTIKFSDLPRLRDGQNRLMACVRSGVPFSTHVVFGIDDDAFTVMDRGKNRDGGDVLQGAGYSNATMLAAAVRWAYLVDEGKVKQRTSLEPDETLRLLTERYPSLDKFIPQARSIYSVTAQPPGLVAGLLYHFDRANSLAASDFSAAWESGNTTGKYAPIGKMQRAIAQHMAASSGRIHDVVRAALVVTAWNVYREKRQGTAKDFEWDPSMNFPQIRG